MRPLAAQEEILLECSRSGRHISVELWREVIEATSEIGWPCPGTANRSGVGLGITRNG
jgi:hypothetical protein